MNLFSEKKNRYFDCCRNLINQAVQRNGLSLNEMRSIVSQQGFFEYDREFIQALTGTPNDVFDDIQLFEEMDGKYFPLLRERVPFVLSSMETVWLHKMLWCEGLAAFGNESLFEKLRQALNDQARDGILPALSYDSDGCFNERIVANLKTILRAFDSQSCLAYTNHVPDSAALKGRLLPYKIEFSAKLRGLWLIGYEIHSERMIKMTIERLDGLKVVPCKNYADITALAKQHYETATIQIEIIDTKGALERALHVFSEYKRDSVFDKERNVHLLDLEYYTFDEFEIVKTLLSLGANVRVISPKRIRETISETIRSQIGLLL